MASAKVCSSEALEFTQPEPFTPHHLSPPNASTRVLEDSFFTELRVRSLQAETVTLASPQYIHSFQKHFLDTYHGRPALSGAGVQRKSEGALSSGSLQLGGRQTWQKEHTCDAGVMVLREDGRGGGVLGWGMGTQARRASWRSRISAQSSRMHRHEPHQARQRRGRSVGARVVCEAEGTACQTPGYGMARAELDATVTAALKARRKWGCAGLQSVVEPRGPAG